MKIEPSGEDQNCLGEEFPMQQYRLPEKGSVLLEVESDTRFTEWSYFWLTFCRGTVGPAWYRVFEKGENPSEWLPLKSVAEVLEYTGVELDSDDDDDPEETRRGREGKIGAAEKLRAGQYLFEVKIGRGNAEYELTAIEFKVAAVPAKPAAVNSVQSVITNPRCSMSAVVSFIKLPRVAVSGLADLSRIWKFSGVPEPQREDLFAKYLKVCGAQPIAKHSWGVAMVTLLSYLQEKHQITLMKSSYDKMIPVLTEWRKAPQFIFTETHRREFLAKIGDEFPEQKLRDYFQEYNGTDDPEAGKKMINGLGVLRESLNAVDGNSVILFSISEAMPDFS